MKIAFIAGLLLPLILITPALAHCPLCTAATGAAVLVTRSLGIDDLVVGVFIGGFVLSTSFWFDRILKRRNKGIQYIPLQNFLLVVLGLASTIITFVLANLTGPTNPIIFGFNRLILGTIIGTIVSYSAFEFHKLLKTRFGRSFIPFQGIVFTLLSLTLVSFGFYVATWV